MEAPTENCGDYNEIVIPPECAGLRLDAALARLLPAHSRSRWQTWLKEGRVAVDGAAPQLRRKVHGGEQIRFAPPPPPAPTDLAEDLPLPLLYEDDALLVIDKPAGLVVHPGAGNRSGTLMNALLHHHPALAALPRAGIVHRLDKDTSGLMVVAKTLTAQTSLVRQLQQRTVTRQYLALARGRVAAPGAGDVIDAPLGRHPRQRTRMAVLQHGGKEARTRYVVREYFAAAGCTLLECNLDTGRTHQIRVHMASIGHPLVGDATYGRRNSNTLLGAFARQALHAWRLALLHPQDNSAISWRSPPPADFAALLAALREC